MKNARKIWIKARFGLKQLKEGQTLFWAAAPKGSMTYNSTQGYFLRVSGCPGLRLSSPGRQRSPPFSRRAGGEIFGPGVQVSGNKLCSKFYDNSLNTVVMNICIHD